MYVVVSSLKLNKIVNLSNIEVQQIFSVEIVQDSLNGLILPMKKCESKWLKS